MNTVHASEEYLPCGPMHLVPVIRAYRAGYAHAEVAKETGGIASGVMTAEIEKLYDEEQDVLERSNINAAWLDGFIDGERGAEPMTDRQIVIASDQ